MFIRVRVYVRAYNIYTVLNLIQKDYRETGVFLYPCSPLFGGGYVTEGTVLVIE